MGCLTLAGAIGAVALLAGPSSAAATVTERFGSNANGWTVEQDFSGPTEDPTYLASGANPGGAIRFTDSVAYDDVNLTGFGTFVAPASPFSGDFSGYYGGSLTYDYETSAPTPDQGFAEVFVVGNGVPLVGLVDGTTGSSWSTLSVPLVEDQWLDVSQQGNPVPATKAEFLGVLADIQTVQIAADADTPSGETSDLDNVSIKDPVVNKRKLTLSFKHSDFKGKLSAGGAVLCVGGQKVTVFRKRRGPDAKIGSDKTTGGRHVLLGREAGHQRRWHLQVRKVQVGKAALRPFSRTRGRSPSGGEPTTVR